MALRGKQRFTTRSFCQFENLLVSLNLRKLLCLLFSRSDVLDMDIYLFSHILADRWSLKYRILKPEIMATSSK